MMKLATSLLLAILLAWPASLNAAQKNKTDAPPGKNYVYKNSGGQPRDMEIYFPPNHDPAKAKVPGVIMFHGGGWKGGTLSQFQNLCHYLAGRGLVAATVNYRMLSQQEAKQLPAGETYKRVCITDAKSAIRWFKQHAAELGIDPQRIITGGGSAGGHICVLATTNPGLDDPQDPKGIDTSVAGYLLFNPAFSPDDKKDPEIDAMRHLKAGFAPAIAFFGTQDPWKPGWDAVQAKLKELGNTGTEVWLAEGEAHSFFNKEPWQTLTIIEADRFLARQGFLKGEPTMAAPAGGEKLVRAEGLANASGKANPAKVESKKAARKKKAKKAE